METKVNYTVVGLFVVTLIAALVAGILWLSGGAKYRKFYDTYLTYMNESVSGLNLNAPVKYRGVEVGRVKRISLDEGERVRLELDIERGTPIKENTIAILKVQGLTGIAQIELTGGTREARALAASGEEPPVIPAGPSLLARLDTAATDLLTSFNRTSDNINGVLDKDNQRAFKALLADLSAISATLVARRDSIDASLRGAARTTEHTAAASAELPRLIERLNRSAESLEKMAGEAARASVSVRKSADSVNGGMARIADDVLPEAERALNDIRELSATLKRVGEELERNPNQLLVGKAPRAPGPGE